MAADKDNLLSQERDSLALCEREGWQVVRQDLASRREQAAWVLVQRRTHVGWHLGRHTQQRIFQFIHGFVARRHLRIEPALRARQRTRKVRKTPSAALRGSNTPFSDLSIGCGPTSAVCDQHLSATRCTTHHPPPSKTV
jgi:hypothetical protein